MTLHNKTIVVTGCCSGIGADFAKLARQQFGVQHREAALV